MMDVWICDLEFFVSFEFNLSSTVSAYECESQSYSANKITVAALKAGSVTTAKHVWGKSQEVSGTWHRVDGDITKIRWVPGLSSAAYRLLHNVEHTCRRLTGTTEARHGMRYDTQAHRI